MKILLTGASGFLGRCIRQKLSGHEIITIGRHNSDIQMDLSEKFEGELPLCELVIHAAGKAHFIPRNNEEQRAFYQINVEGTRHLLEAFKNNRPERLVFISSVSVYGLSTGTGIKESAPLLATDPYGKSKIEAERLIMDWGEKNKVQYTILRLPLIVGENPPGNLGSMINGIRKGMYFNIADGGARKSMVLATDVSAWIERASEKGGVFNLTDGYHPTMIELSNSIGSQLGKKVYTLPVKIAQILATVGNLLGDKAPFNSERFNKMTSSLTFDDSSARETFGWSPKPVLDLFKI